MMQARQWHMALLLGAALGTTMVSRSDRVGAQGASPELLSPSLRLQTVVSGLQLPIALAFLGENDLLVLEKDTGRVKRVTDGVVGATVLDLGVNNTSERGLLGIALHPDFPANPGVYLYWTCRRPAAPADPFFAGRDGVPRRRTCSCPTPATSSQVPLLGNRVDRFIWDGSALTFDQQPAHAACVPERRRADSARTGRRGAAGARQPQRRRASLRARWQALRRDRRQRPPRPAAEPGRRPRRPDARGRSVRRSGAGRRRISPASSCGSTTTARRRPTTRSSPPARRMGGEVGDRPEDLRLRPPQRLRHGVRSEVGQALGAGERRRLLSAS